MLFALLQELNLAAMLLLEAKVCLTDCSNGRKSL
jgi:hypothetical protein